MMATADRPSVGERYVHAAGTRNLRMRGGRCDADMLLAAGYASAKACGACHGAGRTTLKTKPAGVAAEPEISATATVTTVRCQACFGAGRLPDARLSLGLRLYRMQVTGDLSDLVLIEAAAMALLQGWLSRGANRSMPALQRLELVRAVLQWWQQQSCAYCCGLGFELLAGAPALSLVECVACHGVGRKPLNRVLPGALVKHGSWLAHELDVLCAGVIGDMAAVLNRGMEP